LKISNNVYLPGGNKKLGVLIDDAKTSIRVLNANGAFTSRGSSPQKLT